MQQYLQNKKGLVENVFDQVYDQYDLMNDFMSFGIHRLWKKDLLNMMGPSPNHKLIDVACGTGDVAKLFLNHTNKDSHVTCVDPNKGMIKKGKEKLNKYKNLKWIIAPAEKLPIVKNSFDLYKSKLFKVQGDSLIMTAKKHLIRTKILVPPYKKLIIEAGAEIDIVNKGSFISHSAVYALGTADKPILVHSSDSTANGFIVLQANEKSKLSHTTFKNLNTLNYDGWVLTGAVNFYESDVELSNCEFISNHCEDALNIVRSDFKVDKARFYDIYADAFDSDFCTGELTNSVFDKVDNDAIDFSTSQITISDCEISNTSDKGISGGEQSTLKVYNTNITNCNIGAASKDLSQVELINVSISNCNYGLVALRKKPEYGPAKIYTEGLKMSDCLTDELLELNSVLNREGNIKKGYRKNVAAMFY